MAKVDEDVHCAICLKPWKGNATPTVARRRDVKKYALEMFQLRNWQRIMPEDEQWEQKLKELGL